jgi:hypothetical protein
MKAHRVGRGSQQVRNSWWLTERPPDLLSNLAFPPPHGRFKEFLSSARGNGLQPSVLPEQSVLPGLPHFGAPGICTRNSAFTGASTTNSAVTVFTSGGKSRRNGWMPWLLPWDSGFANQ